jgi:hypothetical protein
MRLFTDGAEFGDMLFWSASNGAAVNATARTGNYSYGVGSHGSHYMHKSFTDSSEIYLRYGIYLTSTNLETMMAIRTSGGTDILNMKYNGGNFRFSLGGFGGTVILNSSINVSAGSFHLIEIHFKMDDSTGILEVKIDGLSAGSYSGDTKPDSNTTVGLLRFETNYSTNFYIDDLALNDTSNTDGLNDTSWCGDGKIELLIPNGNGSLNQWTGSDSNSTDNYALVDDIPPSSSDYVQDSIPGNKDKYAITDFTGTNKTILRVWAEARAIDTVPESAQMKIGLRTNSVDYVSPAISLGTTYGAVKGTEYKLNPNDSAAWEDADLDSLELVLETV